MDLILVNANIARRNKNNIFSGVNTFAGVNLNVDTYTSSQTLSDYNNVVIFTGNSTATLPAATGSGQTYRIICRSGMLTIEGNGTDTIKGELRQTLNPSEDLIITDTATGLWE
jgi:hypothetical protein